MKNKACIYTTYDKDLKKYFDDIGIRNILYGLNPKTHNMFWVYERTQLFNQILQDYYKR